MTALTQVDVDRPDRKGREQLFSKYIAPLKVQYPTRGGVYLRSCQQASTVPPPPPARAQTSRMLHLQIKLLHVCVDIETEIENENERETAGFIKIGCGLLLFVTIM